MKVIPKHIAISNKKCFFFVYKMNQILKKKKKKKNQTESKLNESGIVNGITFY